MLTAQQRKDTLKGMTEGLAKLILPEKNKVNWHWSRPVITDQEKTDLMNDGSLYKKHGSDVYLTIHVIVG